MFLRRVQALPLIAGVALLAAGCSAGSIRGALGSAGDSFGRGVGSALGAGVGRAVGDRLAAGAINRLPPVMTPDLTNLYIGYIFNIAFHSGSYSLEQVPYEEGEWTRWLLTADGEGGAELERAFLGRTAEGNEWWRVRYSNIGDGDDAEMILEGLFSEDKTRIVRLRALMPDSDTPSEMPIQEGTYGYVPATQLTDESIEGATIGVEEVTVPAGTFEARHVRYGSLAGGSLEWWLVDRVPGGMVRYTTAAADDESVAVVELADHGSGAKSVLGIEL